MKTAIGALRHRIQLQTLPAIDDSTRDERGGVDRTWQTISNGHRWASIEPLNGNELWRAQQVNTEITGRIKMRYMADLPTPLRVKHGSHAYDILAVININEADEELHLLSKEAA